MSSLDLGDCVLQQREDGMCREVSTTQLRQELDGAVSPDPDDWWPPTSEVGPTAGHRFVWGLVREGLPERVVVGDARMDVHTDGPFWGCAWDRAGQPIEVVFSDRIERFGGRPHYLPDDPDATR